MLTTTNIQNINLFMLNSIGFLKPGNPRFNNQFGTSIALSADGKKFAIGAPRERSKLLTSQPHDCDNIEPLTNCALFDGAVYVYHYDDFTSSWKQMAHLHLKNATPSSSEQFGAGLAFSADGNTLVIGSIRAGIFSQGDKVYVYRYNPDTNWKELATVVANIGNNWSNFGFSLALSDDGNTLAVGAPVESGARSGINQFAESDCTLPPNNQINCAQFSGAAYIFRYDPQNGFVQQAYIKSSNTGTFDEFGWSLDLSADGNTLAVGAHDEDSPTIGINGNQNDDCIIFDPALRKLCAADSGAIYVYRYDSNVGWQQQAYIKASNTLKFDHFGSSLAVSADGNVLAVGAKGERSGARGINRNQINDCTAPVSTQSNCANQSGAVYIFNYKTVTGWQQNTYIKPANTETGIFSAMHFGETLALSEDGKILAIGAPTEDGAKTGITSSDDTDCGLASPINCAITSGAVYVYRKDTVEGWVTQTYIKATNTQTDARFGSGIALSRDGNTLAIGAIRQNNLEGAAYLY